MESIKELHKKIKKDDTITEYLDNHINDNIKNTCNQFIELFDKTMDIKLTLK